MKKFQINSRWLLYTISRTVPSFIGCYELITDKWLMRVPEKIKAPRRKAAYGSHCAASATGTRIAVRFNNKFQLNQYVGSCFARRTSMYLADLISLYIAKDDMWEIRFLDERTRYVSSASKISDVFLIA